MVKKLIKLAIVFLVLHAGYRFGSAYLRYERFKDAVHELTLFSKEKEDSIVLDQVMDLARRYDVPLEREFVQVRRDENHIDVDAAYVELIEWMPGYRRPWQFDVGASASRIGAPALDPAGR